MQQKHNNKYPICEKLRILYNLWLHVEIPVTLFHVLQEAMKGQKFWNMAILGLCYRKNKFLATVGASQLRILGDDPFSLDTCPKISHIIQEFGNP